MNTIMKSLLLGALSPVLQPFASGAGILELLENADVVVLGEATETPSPKEGVTTLSVSSDIVLKGSTSVGLPIEVEVPEWKGRVMSGPAPAVPPRPGAYGLWFVKVEVTDDLTRYHKPVAFSVSRSWVPPASVSSQTVLLRAVLSRYRTDLADPAYNNRRKVPGESWLVESVQYAHLYGAHDAAVEIVDEMMRSSTAAEQHLGIVLGIRMSHDPAMEWLESNLESILSNQKLRTDILTALELHHDPQAQNGLGRIRNLIRQNQNSQISGLDLALAKSLWKITGPRGLPETTVLPLAALLLDSPDPKASRQASHHFYRCAMTRIKGSFLNDDFRAHSGLNEDVSAAENAAFWRRWWSENEGILD